MRLNKLIVVPALLVAVLWVPGAATGAASKNVPPGVSGENQYTETLPGPGGNGPTSSGGGGSAAQVLGAENAKKLEALGPEGRAAAQLAAESAPEKGGDHSKQAGGKGTDTTIGARSGKEQPNGSGSSGVAQVLGQITGTGGSNSGGMNWLLPLLIGASVVIAAAYMFSRRRPARPQD